MKPYQNTLINNMTKETPMEETKECTQTKDCPKHKGGYECPNELPNKEECEKCGRTSDVVKLSENCPFCSPSDKTWDLCCRKEILRLWLRSGSMDIVRYTGECPECKHFIGLTQTSLEEATKFMEDTLPSATIKAKEEVLRDLDAILFNNDVMKGQQLLVNYAKSLGINLEELNKQLQIIENNIKYIYGYNNKCTTNKSRYK